MLVTYTHDLTAASPRPALLPAHGSGSAPCATSTTNDDSSLIVHPSVEQAADGDDYIEGNGGNDAIFGGLGQDDIVGDSSDLYISGLLGQLVRIDGQPGEWRIVGVSVDGSALTLVGRKLLPAEEQAGLHVRTIMVGSHSTTGVVTITPITLGTPSRHVGLTLTRSGFDWHSVGYCIAAECRPVGADLSSVAPAPTSRATSSGRDGGREWRGDRAADGSCARRRRDRGRQRAGPAHREAVSTSPTGNAFEAFVYDNYAGGLRLIPRAVQFLDYTLGGPAYSPAAANDRGENDELHGESGDDQIYGMKGDDVLFGEGQDDDLIGGYGDDWISGGTGDDGVIGDDGRISTSRNTRSSASRCTASRRCSRPIRTRRTTTATC